MRLKRRLREAGAPTWKLLTTDVWDVEASALPYIKRKLVRATRIFTIVGRGFKEDECGLHASALTYMTLLSFVPVLALAVSVVKGMSDTEILRTNSKNFIRSLLISDAKLSSEDSAADGVTNELNVVSVEDATADNGDSPLATNTPALATASENAGGPAAEGEEDDEINEGLTIERLEKMIDSGFDKVEELNFGALGGVGLMFLFWSVIAVVGNIEGAFNKVWGVTKGRTLARKFTDYLSVLIVVPVLVMAASSLPILKVIQDNLYKFDNILKISEFTGWPFFGVSGCSLPQLLRSRSLLIFTPNTKSSRLKPGICRGFCVCCWVRVVVEDMRRTAGRGGEIQHSFREASRSSRSFCRGVFVSWEIFAFQRRGVLRIPECRCIQAKTWDGAAPTRKAALCWPWR